MKLEKRSSFGWSTTPARSAPCKNGIVVHYDGAKKARNFTSHGACRDYWEFCRNLHIADNGWKDIGYSYGVCRHGVVFEGRGFGREQAAQPGGNTTWTSVTFMSAEGESPTAAQVEAFQELRAWLRAQGVSAAIRGHRDFISTSCPGGVLYQLLKGGKLAGAPAAALPVLSRGSTGTWVRKAQQLLRARGQKVMVDGIFGTDTRNKVKRFQTAHGLVADGVIGKKTWAKLQK